VTSRVVELFLALLFSVAGARSLWKWGRRGFRGPRARDHALFAVWLTGRAGVWLSIGGMFLISAAIGTRGRAFTDDFSELRWYVLVPIGLASSQLLAGYLLGRPAPGTEDEGDASPAP
jgi:hypothetical protein